LDFSNLADSWPILSTLAGVIITWLIADAGFKAKTGALEEKVLATKVITEATLADLQNKLGTVVIQNARSEQDRSELHNLVDKLEISKASKDVVDGFKNEVASFKSEMDKRFDRIDRFMEYKILKMERSDQEESS
jgi:hypothetical protein